jgi:glycosyltransferase involved in cell wall biosynthesis
MHILYLHQYFNTPRTGGGIRSYEISKVLIKKGHKVSMITSYGNFYNFKKKKVKFKKIDGINVYFIDNLFDNKTKSSKILSFIYFAIFFTFKALSIKADIVYATSTPLTIVIPALFKRFIQKTPYIFELRDLWPDVPIKYKYINNYFLIKFSLLLEYIAYKYAKKIVVIVDGFKNHLIKFKKIKPSKIIVITQFCYDYKFKINSKVDKFFKKNKKYLLYAGRIDLSHNVEYLVHLANKIYFKDNNIFFLVYGDGPHYNLVKELAKRNNILNKNFFLFKSLSRKKLFKISKYTIAHFALADKFLPKLHLKNNANNKFFFAINCNKPTINNFQSWQTNVAKKNNIGIEINNSNYHVASNQLMFFLKNIKKYSIKKNYKNLQEKFNINRQINLLEKNLF